MLATIYTGIAAHIPAEEIFEAIVMTVIADGQTIRPVQGPIAIRPATAIYLGRFFIVRDESRFAFVVSHVEQASAGHQGVEACRFRSRRHRLLLLGTGTKEQGRQQARE